MGLFRRRDTSETETEIAAMRTAIGALRQELAERDAATERTDAEVRELRDQLDAALAESEQRATAHETALRHQIDTGLGQVEARLGPAVDELDGRLRAIDRRLSTPMTPPPTELPPAATAPPAPGVDLPALEAAALEAVNAHVARIDERLEAVDRRVTAVSTELANQLTEISSDIDALDRAAQDAMAAAAAATTAAESSDQPDTDTPGVDPELLEEIRDAQLRLANEQARYQIAFRDDLARLAADLRRRST